LAVIKYLGRYTHRIAISNNRIVSTQDDDVTIKVKDYKNDNKASTVTLKGAEFIRRFLMHVLLKGFVKIRYYGLLANRNKKTKLSLCKCLTNTPLITAKFEGLSKVEIFMDYIEDIVVPYFKEYKYPSTIYTYPIGIESIADVYILIDNLKKRGYENDDINKISYDNMERVFKASMSRV